MFKKIRNFIDRLEGSIPLDEVDDKETEIPKETQKTKETKSYKEEQEEKIQRYEEERSGCYVCDLPLSKPDSKTNDLFKCPRCGITNILNKSGKMNRPERMEIYKKYDGDLYDLSRSKGLHNEMVAEFDKEFEPIKEQKKNGEIDEKEYKSLYGKWYRKKEKSLEKLEDQKREELSIFVKEEKEIKKRLMEE